MTVLRALSWDPKQPFAFLLSSDHSMGSVSLLFSSLLLLVNQANSVALLLSWTMAISRLVTRMVDSLRLQVPLSLRGNSLSTMISSITIVMKTKSSQRKLHKLSRRLPGMNLSLRLKIRRRSSRCCLSQRRRSQRRSKPSQCGKEHAFPLRNLMRKRRNLSSPELLIRVTLLRNWMRTHLVKKVKRSRRRS